MRRSARIIKTNFNWYSSNYWTNIQKCFMINAFIIEKYHQEFMLLNQLIAPVTLINTMQVVSVKMKLISQLFQNFPDSS